MSNLARYVNPWTVEIRNKAGKWHPFCSDAPITLQEAVSRVEALQAENPDAVFRAQPWRNASQAQEVGNRIAELEAENKALREALAPAPKATMRTGPLQCTHAGIVSIDECPWCQVPK